MYHNISLKDLEAISTSIDICNFAKKYQVFALTNSLEDNSNALVKITGTEDATLGRNVLFSFRTGEQLSLIDLSYSEQLIIPDDELAQLKKSLSISLSLFNGDDKNIWEKTIDKINAKHREDSNSNFQFIPTDLPIPDFKYIQEEKKDSDTISNDTPKKESIFTKIKNFFCRKTKSDQDKEAENK